MYDAMEERMGGRVYTYYFDQDRRYYGEFGPMRIPLSHGTLLNTSYGESLQELYSMDYLNTYRIAGGMINLPFAFYNSLISHNPREYDIAPDLLGNVNINFGHNITGIYQNSSENKVILRYNNTYMKNIYEEFDYVICSIPFSTLREIDIKPFFSNQKMQAIRELFYSDSFKAAFFCNRRFWEENTVYGNMNGGFCWLREMWRKYTDCRRIFWILL